MTREPQVVTKLEIHLCPCCANQEEEGCIVAGESGDDPEELLRSEKETGQCGPVWLKMAECDLEYFVFSDVVRGTVTALDLSNNLLSGIEAPAGQSLVAGSTWLRLLSLQANPLLSCPGKE